MKNGITLLIASVLLVLCVIQKEARYGTTQSENVDKMYNFSPISQKNESMEQPQPEDDLLTDSQNIEFAASDSTSVDQTARLVNQRLLHISANSKMLNY